MPFHSHLFLLGCIMLTAIYSRVVDVAAAATVLGFVLQFLGLRVLHWSSAIAQLLVTAVMTVGRAVSRRRLALVPPSFGIPTTHEMAWLALGVSTIRTMAKNEQANTEEARSARGSKPMEWKRMWQSYSETPIRWEVPMGEVVLDDENESDTPSRNQTPMRLNVEGPFSTSIEQRHKPRPASSWWLADMQAFSDVKYTVPWQAPLPMQDRVHQLVTAIKNVSDFFMTTPDITWNQERLFDPQGAGSPFQEIEVTWKIPITYVRHLPLEVSGVQVVEIPLSLAKFSYPNPYRRWKVWCITLVEGIVCCWIYSLASRCASSRSIPTRPGSLLHMDGEVRLNRLVGSRSAEGAPSESGADLLKEWLGSDIVTLAVQLNQDPLPWPMLEGPGRATSVPSWLGILLADFSRYVLCQSKKTYRRSSLPPPSPPPTEVQLRYEFQPAQEL